VLQSFTFSVQIIYRIMSYRIFNFADSVFTAPCYSNGAVVGSYDVCPLTRTSKTGGLGTTA